MPFATVLLLRRCRFSHESRVGFFFVSVSFVYFGEEDDDEFDFLDGIFIFSECLQNSCIARIAADLSGVVNNSAV